MPAVLDGGAITHTLFMSDGIEVAKSPSGDFSVRATRRLPAGTLVLMEHVFSDDMSGVTYAVRCHHQLYDTLWPRADGDAADNLFSADERIMNTAVTKTQMNCFQFDQVVITAAFSKFNHSCVPNCHMDIADKFLLPHMRGRADHRLPQRARRQARHLQGPLWVEVRVHAPGPRPRQAAHGHSRCARDNFPQARGGLHPNNRRPLQGLTQGPGGDRSAAYGQARTARTHRHSASAAARRHAKNRAPRARQVSRHTQDHCEDVAKLFLASYIKMGLVGEGNTACVFRPALPCVNGETTRTAQTVGKVLKLGIPSLANDEVHTASTAARLKDVNAPAFISRCAVRREDVATSCPGFLGVLPVGFPWRETTVEQVVLEDAGKITLEDLLSSNNLVEPLAMLRAFQDVLRSVAALERAGYAHLDIHAGNILVTSSAQSKKMQLRLIDYGWLRPVNTVWTSFTLVRAFFVALTYAAPVTPHNGPGSRSELAQNAREAYEAYEAYEKNRDSVLKSSGRGLMAAEAAGVDAMASGVILWRMLTLAHEHNDKNKDFKDARYLTVAAGLTFPDARRRLSASDALRILSA